MFAVVSWPATRSSWPIEATSSAVIRPVANCDVASLLRTSSPGSDAFRSTRPER